MFPVSRLCSWTSVPWPWLTRSTSNLIPIVNLAFCSHTDGCSHLPWCSAGDPQMFAGTLWGCCMESGWDAYGNNAHDSVDKDLHFILLRHADVMQVMCFDQGEDATMARYSGPGHSCPWPLWSAEAPLHHFWARSADHPPSCSGPSNGAGPVGSPEGEASLGRQYRISRVQDPQGPHSVDVPEGTTGGPK